MVFWLACFFVCFNFAVYFAGKTSIWPHNPLLPSNNKHGVKVHNFNELKNAQRATISSALISLCVFFVWGIVTRYRFRALHTSPIATAPSDRSQLISPIESGSSPARVEENLTSNLV